MEIILLKMHSITICVCHICLMLSQQLTVGNRLPKSLRSSFVNRRSSKVGIHGVVSPALTTMNRRKQVQLVQVSKDFVCQPLSVKSCPSTDHVNVSTPLEMVITSVRRQCIPNYQFTCANKKFTVFFFIMVLRISLFPQPE